MLKNSSSSQSFKNRFLSLMNPLLSNKTSKSFNDIFNKTMKKNFSNAREIKSDYDGVVYTEHSKYLTEINLNQPKKLNSLDLKMIRNILRKIRLWVPYNIDGFSSDASETAESKPKVVLFTGTGKAFCAGGDITSLYYAKTTGTNTKILKDFFRYEYLLDYSLTKIEPIQVSLWQGAIMGGGVGISINSPYRIATDTSIFAMPESKIGLFTDVGASYFLPKLLNNSIEVGLYLGLTGEKVKGKELAITGVATHYVNQEGFEKLKQILIEKVNDNTDHDSLKALLAENTDISFNPNNFSFPNYDKIKYVFKPDTLDNIFARLDNLIDSKASNPKEESSIKHLFGESTKVWAEKCKSILLQMSPLSLTVILELLKRGQKMSSIEEAFNLEAQVVAGFMEESDFFEGVRALLIDKDNKPKWTHQSYKDVNSEEVIKKYFDRTEEIDVDSNL